MLQLFSYEKDLFNQGIRYVAGVDEVGRGPLAGPMVVAAVVLNIEILNQFHSDTLRNNDIESYQKINDSKKVSKKNREILDVFIKEKALSFKIIEVSHVLIDELGISRVTDIAFYDAVIGLHIKPEHVITDNFRISKFPEQIQTNLPKGDSISISVAAASIIGKVYRDTLMTAEHTRYPEYNFDLHKGYGTKKHLEALAKHGPSPIHRRSFEPIKSMLKV